MPCPCWFCCFCSVDSIISCFKCCCPLKFVCIYWCVPFPFLFLFALIYKTDTYEKVIDGVVMITPAVFLYGILAENIQVLKITRIIMAIAMFLAISVPMRCLWITHTCGVLKYFLFLHAFLYYNGGIALVWKYIQQLNAIESSSGSPSSPSSSPITSGDSTDVSIPKDRKENTKTH